MSLLTTPLWQNLNGDPRTGVSPPSLVMLSGRLTPQSHGEIRQIYMHFSMAKLTAVGDYFVFNRVLSDGTRVRIESMQGRDRVLVWAADAKSEDLWDMGWSFIPANDNSLGGFLRRPGAAPGDLSAAAFMPANFASSENKKVRTFVDAKTGNRHLCTDREGGARMWRGGKHMPALSYDNDAVWVDGVKSVLSPETTGNTDIRGAAIAERGGTKWLVFVVGERLWAVRLSGLEAQTNDCIDCGSTTNADYVFRPLTRWEFSPDGMHAIALGGFAGSAGYAPAESRGIYRIQLVPEDGTVPFRLEVSEQLHGEVIKKRVINTFHFNQAKRNFVFHGWKNFLVDAMSTYYGVIRFDIDSGWGPTFVHPLPSFTNPTTMAREHFRSIGELFDPRMSPYKLDSTRVVLYTNPTNFTSDPITVVIPRSDFLFDDGLAPEQIVYSRTFHPRGPNTPVPLPVQDVGRYFPHLDGWLRQSHGVDTYFFGRKNTVWTPYFGHMEEKAKSKFAEHLAIAAVADEKRFITQSFPTLDELISDCEKRWNRAVGDNLSISRSLNNHYGRLFAKNDYSSYLGFYEYLAAEFPHLISRRRGPGFGVGRYATLDLVDGHTVIYKPDEQPPDEPPPGRNDTIWVDVAYNSRHMVEMTGESTRGRVLAFSLNASLLATPDYTHNWATDWVLESQVFLSGKAYIAAGYDAKGRERFLYMEGDDSQRLRYESSAKADDEPVVQLAWSFSGAMGYRLMLDDEVVDSCTYAVADSVTLPDRMYEGLENLAGPNPMIRAGEITVHDFDIALGHVLYRKSEEVFTAEGAQSVNRKTALRLSYRDFLKTSKDKYQLGEEKVFTSTQREVQFRVARFRNTKGMFEQTAPFFMFDPFTQQDTIVIDGVYVNRYADKFGSLVPQAQQNKTGELSGMDEIHWLSRWLTEMMLYWPGMDHKTCPIPAKIFNGLGAVSNTNNAVGRFDKPPQSDVALRAYSDDCWLVCYQDEKYIQNTDTDNTTARYFLKLAEDKPVGEFDAATYFPYLGASKKLLKPKFHIRKRT